MFAEAISHYYNATIDIQHFVLILLIQTDDIMEKDTT